MLLFSVTTIVVCRAYRGSDFCLFFQGFFPTFFYFKFLLQSFLLLPILLRCDTKFLLHTLSRALPYCMFVCMCICAYIFEGAFVRAYVFLFFAATPISFADRRHWIAQRKRQKEKKMQMDIPEVTHTPSGTVSAMGRVLVYFAL